MCSTQTRQDMPPPILLRPPSHLMAQLRRQYRGSCISCCTCAWLASYHGLACDPTAGTVTRAASNATVCMPNLLLAFLPATGAPDMHSVLLALLSTQATKSDMQLCAIRLSRESWMMLRNFAHLDKVRKRGGKRGGDLLQRAPAKTRGSEWQRSFQADAGPRAPAAPTAAPTPHSQLCDSAAPDGRSAAVAECAASDLTPSACNILNLEVPCVTA